VIDFEAVTITYPEAARPALRDVNLHVPEGEMCLVVGGTGVGKSTLLGAINGLVPHFTGGTLRGRVTVDGLDTRTHPPREMAGTVGMVVQDPEHGFVTDTVEEELAYCMEQFAVPAAVMRKRVEETLDLLGIADLRRRSVRTLSGGQQQRVAIAAALTNQPRVLVLDEPTSALDPAAAEDVLAALSRLVHDLGVTVVLAEHRLERVVEFADMVVLIDADRRVTSGEPQTMMQRSSVAPPVVRLGQLAGWSPLPLSVRDARRRSTELRQQLGDAPLRVEPSGAPAVAIDARRIVVRYGAVVAVSGLDLTVHAGEVLALMGRNGSGKSSLMWAMQGAGSRSSGSVRLAGDGIDPAELEPSQARARVGLVPQSPGDLLYLSQVDAECALADLESEQPAGSCRGILDQIVPGIDGAAHPRDLSEGQRLALVLAVQLCPRPTVIMLDEPTRGLDEFAKKRLARLIGRLATDAKAIMIATHDVEFVASVADRVVVLAGGEIVADGPTPDVVVASPIFAPQVAKVLHPLHWLTVDQISNALGVVTP